MKTALVTGAAGFVGPHLIQSLHTDGLDVYGFDLKTGQDIRDYEQIRLAVDEHDPDLIFHLAAVPYVPESTSDVRRGYGVNTIGTLNLLEAVRHSGSNARILISGTTEEYGYSGHIGYVDETTLPRPTTPYGASKLAAGHLGLIYNGLYGIPVVVTRASNHTGPGHSRAYAVPSFAKRVAEVERGLATAVRHGNLSSVRSYLDVKDVVAAYRLAIELPSGVYNVTSTEAHTMEWILRHLIQLASGDIPLMLDESLYRPGNVQYPEIRSTKLYDATGWEPKVSLTDTLRDVLDYWRGRV